MAKERAWNALSRYARARDKICVTCKTNTAMQGGHYRHNSDKANKQLGGNALWYDERNINGQCSHCNLYKSGRLDEYSLYLESRYGQGILQELERLFRIPKKWTIEELTLVAEKYESKITSVRGYPGGYFGSSESEVQESWLLPTTNITTEREDEGDNNY